MGWVMEGIGRHMAEVERVLFVNIYIALGHHQSGMR
jgi:hypothetical protein